MIATTAVWTVATLVIGRLVRPRGPVTALGKRRHSGRRRDALEIAMHRYARGDISLDQYVEALEDGHGAGDGEATG